MLGYGRMRSLLWRAFAPGGPALSVADPIQSPALDRGSLDLISAEELRSSPVEAANWGARSHRPWQRAAPTSR
jgi:hypothetical protein